MDVDSLLKQIDALKSELQCLQREQAASGKIIDELIARLSEYELGGKKKRPQEAS